MHLLLLLLLLLLPSVVSVEYCSCDG